MIVRLPRLYEELAPWFHLLTAPEDYADEAELYRRLLQEACRGTAHTLLELGSGGGNTASHHKRHFQATLVDVAPRMLEVSRRLNPECEHVPGDMRSVRLGRAFDVVLVHDAVMYLTTEADLLACMTTARTHLRPGGAALFVPDLVRETFVPGTRCGGHDAADGSRGLRYVEWVWDPDDADTAFIADFAYLLRDHAGVRVAHDRHECGLFPRATWRRLLREAGFAEVSVHPITAGEPPRPEPEAFLARTTP
jgi:SAM-dependent methyltransferase